jgi:hypothetical protein
MGCDCLEKDMSARRKNNKILGVYKGKDARKSTKRRKTKIAYEKEVLVEAKEN